MAMAKSRRWLLAAAVFLLVLAACTGTAGRPGPGTGTAGTPAGSGPAALGGRQGLAAVQHVWVIELENQGYAQSFGNPSADPYLARTLPRMGALLENYYAIGHSSAANYVAQISGQAPDLGTQSDCPVWLPFAGQVIAGPYHQVLGEGCVYPAAVPTLGNQLSAARAGHRAAPHRQDPALRALPLGGKDRGLSRPLSQAAGGRQDGDVACSPAAALRLGVLEMRPLSDGIPARRFPVVNVLLIVANFAVFIFYELPHLNAAVYHASFYPEVRIGLVSGIVNTEIIDQY